MRHAYILATFEGLQAALGLPEDTTILGVHQGESEHQTGRKFIIHITHPSLPDVPEGVCCGEITAAFHELWNQRLASHLEQEN